MKKNIGYTLLELLITIAIVGILAAIAAPTYQNYVFSTRRADALAELLGLQMAQESWRIGNATYGSITDLGGSPASDYYTYSVSNNTATTYTITATAKSSQTGDSGCTSITINQSDIKLPADCWD